VRAAAVKKPGRATGRPAGAAYYRNYLRNRQAKGGEFLGPPVAGPPPTAQQQQQQQQQQPSNEELPAAGGAVIDQTRIQGLLQQCLIATAPAATQPVLVTPPYEAAAAAGPSQPDQQAPDHQQQQQLREVLPQDRQRARQQHRQPWEFSDFVSAELADGVVQLLKPRRGTVVAPPVIPTGECDV
jgi:hypothetical protein